MLVVLAFGAALVHWYGGSPPGPPSTRAEPPFVVAPQVTLHKIGETSGPAHARRRDPAAGVPLGLVVPKLRIDAPVVPIDAPGGVLIPPSNPQTLGWWSAGAKAGAKTGSALITGHTVHTGGGAFDDLETLQKGDSVRVRTGKGIIDYTVTGVRIFHKASLAEHAQSVFSQTVPGRLVLITCEDWTGSVYLSNAVVFAVPRG